ncbi:MAG: M20/M25/M40 family metallo-hydrolase [Ferruginibacter sp.]
MKQFCCLLFFSIQLVHAQKLKKADKAVIANLQTHITYLADDKLEGRRAGSAGEKLAYEYISSEFSKAGLSPKGENGSFLQPFEINEGKIIDPASYLVINDNHLEIDKDFFPLSFCPDKSLDATAALALQENGSPWFFDIKELVETNKNNPHYDLEGSIKKRVAKAASMGATAYIIYNSSNTNDALKFDGKEKPEHAVIPVLYVRKTAREKWFADETATLDIKLKVKISEKKRYGHNVIGYVDNNAGNTIVIGAHYDHLGYGEDNNALYTGKDKVIFNGADDNASGTAALIEAARFLKASRHRNNNYLFIAFSGEEIGLFGSKYFVEHPTIDLSNINYMLNMDMIGRLNDSTHKLVIGGYGTSPAWGAVINTTDKNFSVKTDSSGVGPSDHTSFYRKGIPVLFFFTGLHADYHKPGDDAEKINYNGELQVLKYTYGIIEAINKKGKITFTKTREMQNNSTPSFTVTLGIMPDYSFTEKGVRVDAVSEGKLAQKAGIKTGDVLQQLGDHPFTDLQTYMQALSKFSKGDATKVKLKRGNEEMVFDIVF